MIILKSLKRIIDRPIYKKILDELKSRSHNGLYPKQQIVILSPY